MNIEERINLLFKTGDFESVVLGAKLLQSIPGVNNQISSFTEMCTEFVSDPEKEIYILPRKVVGEDKNKETFNVKSEGWTIYCNGNVYMLKYPFEREGIQIIEI
jgi:hypothetical protein